MSARCLGKNLCCRFEIVYLHLSLQPVQAESAGTSAESMLSRLRHRARGLKLVQDLLVYLYLCFGLFCFGSEFSFAFLFWFVIVVAIVAVSIVVFIFTAVF